MLVAFFLAGDITQVKESIPWVRCASGNVSSLIKFKSNWSKCFFSYSISIDFSVHLLSLTGSLFHLLAESWLCLGRWFLIIVNMWNALFWTQLPLMWFCLGSCMVTRGRLDFGHDCLWLLWFWRETSLLVSLAMLFHLVGEKLLVFTSQVKWPSERKGI